LGGRPSQPVGPAAGSGNCGQFSSCARELVGGPVEEARWPVRQAQGAELVEGRAIIRRKRPSDWMIPVQGFLPIAVFP
jgi:hypothetical protein